RHTPKAQKPPRAGLIAPPEPIPRKLRAFERTNADQTIPLNQTGRTPHEEISGSPDPSPREARPRSHARSPEPQRWKAAAPPGRIRLDRFDTSAHSVYAHQNEDIVRLTPDELKRKMAAKEAAEAAAGGAGIAGRVGEPAR